MSCKQPILHAASAASTVCDGDNRLQVPAPRMINEMDKEAYVAALSDNAALLAASARRRMDPPVPSVPSCPGWTMTVLVLHMGSIYRLVARRVAEREREMVSYSERFTPEDWSRVLHLDAEWTQLAYEEKVSADRPLPAWLIDWFEEGASRLVETFQAVDPDERIGTWWPPEQRAGFWMRRMAHETAVHRWDAQNAVGEAQPIETALARDGVDEVMDIILPNERPESDVPGRGESYRFRQTDGDGEWTVRFEPDGLNVTHGPGDAAVEVRASASDLLLFLLGRVPADRVEVSGDRSILSRYFELVPAF